MPNHYDSSDHKIACYILMISFELESLNSKNTDQVDVCTVTVILVYESVFLIASMPSSLCHCKPQPSNLQLTVEVLGFAMWFLCTATS